MDERRSQWDRKGHYPLPTTRNLFYTCEICLACRMFCGWAELWMGSVFPHYVTGLFISPMANNPISCKGFSLRSVWSSQPLEYFNQANTNGGQNILRSDLQGSVLFNSCEYLSLRVKCLVSHSRGKYYFGNQRLVRSWCRSRSTRACGFVQGQQWRNALVEQM